MQRLGADASTAWERWLNGRSVTASARRMLGSGCRQLSHVCAPCVFVLVERIIPMRGFRMRRIAMCAVPSHLLPHSVSVSTRPQRPWWRPVGTSCSTLWLFVTEACSGIVTTETRLCCSSSTWQLTSSYIQWLAIRWPRRRLLRLRSQRSQHGSTALVRLNLLTTTVSWSLGVFGSLPCVDIATLGGAGSVKLDDNDGNWQQ